MESVSTIVGISMATAFSMPGLTIVDSITVQDFIILMGIIGSKIIIEAKWEGFATRVRGLWLY